MDAGHPTATLRALRLLAHRRVRDVRLSGDPLAWFELLALGRAVEIARRPTNRNRSRRLSPVRRKTVASGRDLVATGRVDGALTCGPAATADRRLAPCRRRGGRRRPDGDTVPGGPAWQAQLTVRTADHPADARIGARGIRPAGRAGAATGGRSNAGGPVAGRLCHLAAHERHPHPRCRRGRRVVRRDQGRR